MEANLLKAKTVEAIKAPGLHSDGGGLFLQVSKTGARSWILRWKVGGKQKSMGLGSFPSISLAAARISCRDAQAKRAAGLNPIDERRAILAKKVEVVRLEKAQAVTFEKCCEGYLRDFGPTLKNAKHAAQWRSTLFTHAVPAFGATPIADLSRQQVLDVLKTIWWKTPETASRLRGRIETVIGYGIAAGHRTAPNCAEWKGLKGALPLKSKIKAVTHHAALPYSEVAKLVQELRTTGGLPELALEMLILTAVRTRELLLAERSEFDLDAGLWTIPTLRMKAKRHPHRVPLAPRVIEIVRQAIELGNDSDQYLFPGRKASRPFSDMVFLMMLRRMGHGEVTGHGFRSTFKVWASECTAYPDLISEMALAHLVGNEVSRSYQRSDLLEKRRALMIDWAEFVEPKKTHAETV